MPTAVSAADAPVTLRASRWWTPSIPELLFAAVVLWMIAFTLSGDVTGAGLLRDSQTGYHIRIGEYVLAHGTVPQTDSLSFTKSGEPFYAWEWLAGVGSALLYEWGGLRLITIVSALLVGFTVLVMLRHLAWRGTNVLVAIFLIHFAIGASSIHYLARPHLFTLLFLAVAFWVLDRDRRRPTKLIWVLVPLTALWANLHGGFFGLLVSLGILTAGTALEWILLRDPALRARALRWGALAAACFGGSLLNPYGIYEHVHLIEFMRQTWYLKLTEEYQPPHYLSGSGAYFGVLLAAGVVTAVCLARRRQFAPALLTLAWGYAASRSMRHIPIYAIAALPWIAGEAMRLWHRWVDGKPAKTLPGLLAGIAADFQPSMQRTSLFVPLAAAVLLLAPFDPGYPRDFPAAVYPVAMVNHHAAEIGKARVFTTDGWGHYLTFKYPEPYRIYIDGRCDFFGEQFTQEYLDTLNGEPGWEATLDKYEAGMVLIPPEMVLAARLEESADWQLVERSPQAVLFARRHAELKSSPGLMHRNDAPFGSNLR